MRIFRRPGIRDLSRIATVSNRGRSWKIKCYWSAPDNPEIIVEEYADIDAGDHIELDGETRLVLDTFQNSAEGFTRVLTHPV